MYILVEHKWKAARQYLEWDSTSQTVAQVRKSGQGLGSVTATAQFVHFVFAQFGNVIIFQVVQRTFGFMILVVMQGIVFFVAKWKSHDRI